MPLTEAHHCAEFVACVRVVDAVCLLLQDALQLGGVAAEDDEDVDGGLAGDGDDLDDLDDYVQQLDAGQGSTTLHCCADRNGIGRGWTMLLGSVPPSCPSDICICLCWLPELLVHVVHTGLPACECWLLNTRAPLKCSLCLSLTDQTCPHADAALQKRKRVEDGQDRSWDN